MPVIGRLRYLEQPAGGTSRPRGTLVLIHAFPLNARMWEPQLTLAANGWRVIAPQLRGMDSSSTDQPATSMDNHAADVVDLLDALHIEDAVVGGLSMGGYVAFAVLRHAPRYVRALILADTRSEADTPEGVEGRKRMLALVQEKGVAAIADEMIPKLLAEETRRRRPNHQSGQGADPVEFSRRLREGLGYDRNDVAVVTNVAGDHLGIGGIDTLRQLADVKGVLVEAVPRTGSAVLNADDINVARMGQSCDGAVVYFTMETEKHQPGYDRVDGHCGRGGAAFVLRHTPEGDQIVLRHGPRVMPVLYTHLIPATFGGKARMNVQNALAAAAAAWASGAHLHDIRQGLRTFTTSFFQAPGRLNMVEVAGVRVVIDYCHNVDGMRALSDFVNRMMVENGVRDGRAIGVIGVPGDRRDDDMRGYGALAATAFDEIIVREDRNLRGRSPGETAAHVLDGIRAARADGARATKSEKILKEMTAVRAALRRANPGDLLVMCVDDAIGVYKETMATAGQGLGTTAFADPGELEAPEG